MNIGYELFFSSYLFYQLFFDSIFSFLGNYDDENGSYLAIQHDHLAYSSCSLLLVRNVFSRD